MLYVLCVAQTSRGKSRLHLTETLQLLRLTQTHHSGPCNIYETHKEGTCLPLWHLTFIGSLHTYQWAYVIMICLSCVMCHCHCCWHHCDHHWCHLCTAIPLRTLITETLYLAIRCTYIPSICIWNIGSIWIIFLKLWIFLKIYILHFLAHIHTKDINFTFGTPHTQYRYTQTNGHTQTHMDTDVVPLSHFALLWHACMPKI